MIPVRSILEGAARILQKFLTKPHAGSSVSLSWRAIPVVFGAGNVVTVSGGFSPSFTGGPILEDRRLAKEASDVAYFSGKATLGLVRFVKELESLGLYDRCVVYVDGYDNKELRNTVLFGKPVESELDGYVRTLKLIDSETGEQKDLGGTNATKERIAARQVAFRGISSSLFHKLASKYVPFRGDVVSKQLVARDSLRECDFLRSNLPNAIAENLTDEQAMRVLKSYLRADLERTKMEMVTESFRTFEDICATRRDLSIEATRSLTTYIRNNIRKADRGASVVYAIESLGYVANHWPTTRRLVCEFLSRKILTNEKNRAAHRDVVWATLVTLDRTLSPALNMEVIRSRSLRDTISEHPYEQVLGRIIDRIEDRWLVLKDFSE